MWLWRKHGVSREAVAGFRKSKQVCLHYTLAERVNLAGLSKKAVLQVARLQADQMALFFASLGLQTV